MKKLMFWGLVLFVVLSFLLTALEARMAEAATPPTPAVALRLEGNVVGTPVVPGGVLDPDRGVNWELAHALAAQDWPGHSIKFRLELAPSGGIYTEGGGFVAGGNSWLGVYDAETGETLGHVQVECWNRQPPEISFSATCESRTITLDNSGGASSQTAKALVVWFRDRPSDQWIRDEVEVVGGQIEEFAFPWPKPLRGNIVAFDVQSYNGTASQWANSLNKRETVTVYCPGPTCESVIVSPLSGSEIPDTGQGITVVINGFNGEEYRIVNLNTNEVVIGPCACSAFSFTAFPGNYQGQVHSSVYDEWTNYGCEFNFAAVGHPTCDSISTTPASGSEIPDTGTTAEVNITGSNGNQYRVVNKTTGEVVTGPGATSTMSFVAFPGINYQGQVYTTVYDEWTNYGCEFNFGAPPPSPENPWVEGEQSIPDVEIRQDPPLRGKAWVWSWNLGVNDGILYIPMPEWMLNVRDVHVVKWDGSVIKTTEIQHPEWGRTLRAVIGSLGPAKTPTNWVDYELYFDLPENIAPGKYGHVSHFHWTHQGKPWGNDFGCEFEVKVVPGRPPRQLNPDGTYTVVVGDSLYWIARSFNTTVQAIAEANNIANPDLIIVGQVLEIPLTT